MNAKPHHILILGTKTAVNSRISGASLRVESLRTICEDLGFEVEVKESTYRNVRNAEDNKILVFCSFAAVWPLVFKRKKHFVWLDSTDSIKLTLKFQLQNLASFRSVLSSLRALVAYKVISGVDMISFISQRDSVADMSITSRLSSNIFIFPNQLKRWETNVPMTPRFIFMGSLNYSPNASGLIQLLTFLKGKNLLQILEKIHVFGENPESLGKNFPEVHWHGYTSYVASPSDVHLAPIFHGAGIKNKVAFPLISNLKVISSLEGANGIVKNPLLLICGDLDDFVQHMTDPRVFETVLFQKKEGIFEVDQTRDLINFLLNIENQGNFDPN